MDKLKICLRDRLWLFVLSVLLVFGYLWIYPKCVKSVYELFFLPDQYNWADNNLLDDLIVVVFGLPTVLILLLRIKNYICILLDIKEKKQVTIVVRGAKRPEAETFDNYVIGTKDKNDIFFYWKAIDDSKKRYKFTVFKDVNTLIGETTRHYYSVTYFKYSKIVTHIEKAKGYKIKR